MNKLLTIAIAGLFLFLPLLGFADTCPAAESIQFNMVAETSTSTTPLYQPIPPAGWKLIHAWTQDSPVVDAIRYPQGFYFTKVDILSFFLPLSSISYDDNNTTTQCDCWYQQGTYEYFILKKEINKKIEDIHPSRGYWESEGWKLTCKSVICTWDEQ